MLFFTVDTPFAEDWKEGKLEIVCECAGACRNVSGVCDIARWWIWILIPVSTKKYDKSDNELFIGFSDGKKNEEVEW